MNSTTSFERKAPSDHLPDHISIIRKKESICVQRVVKSYLNHKQNTTLGQDGQVFGRRSTLITLNSIAIPDMVCDGPKLLVAIVAAISDTSSMMARNQLGNDSVSIHYPSIFKKPQMRRKAVSSH